jgi:hypothetical protein
VHAQEQAPGLPADEKMKIRLKQGRAIYGVDMKIVDADGNELPWDGKTYGDLLVKGPWIISSYFKGEGGWSRTRWSDGWFPTGDVATIDADGFMQITDRSKDVIKSGGEWISSIDVENIAMAHPAVAMAACIGMPHPKWDERPIVVVVKSPAPRSRATSCWRSTTARRQVADPRRCGVRRGHPAGRHRQDAEDQAARAMAQGLQAARAVRSSNRRLRQQGQPAGNPDPAQGRDRPGLPLCHPGQRLGRRAFADRRGEQVERAQPGQDRAVLQLRRGRPDADQRESAASGTSASTPTPK